MPVGRVELFRLCKNAGMHARCDANGLLLRKLRHTEKNLFFFRQMGQLGLQRPGHLFPRDETEPQMYQRNGNANAYMLVFLFLGLLDGGL